MSKTRSGSPMPPDDGLTNQELSWLLAQEAKAAAETLRQGVVRLSLLPPAEPSIKCVPGELDDIDEIEASLAALDDAVRMLDSLNANRGKKATRGRVDLAALVVDLVPEARVRLEPGSGTEVFGDESELRHMIQILLGDAGSMVGGSEIPEVSIGRDGDEVRVSVALGCEVLSGDRTERVWLARAAARHGGRFELEGSQESLVLPAEGARDRREMEAMREELEAAQQQGEVCARELADLFTVARTVGRIACDSSFPKMRVLVVEAQESVRRIVEALLSGCGLDVVGVSNGAKALETCMRDRPDIVLLSLTLPGPYDGFEVCCRLREEPSTHGVPIVAFVGPSDEEARERAAEAGATAFCTRPVSPVGLLREIGAIGLRTCSSQ